MSDAYLYEIPNSTVNPPVQTKKQLLPFLDLTWEDFERLTLRYACKFGGIDSTARLYGVRGQKQEGIDIYVRNNSNPTYSVFQCKRYTKYSAGKIKKAIKEFRDGDWYSKADRFYLCATCDLSEKK